MHSVNIEVLRDYSGRKITSLIVGQVVIYADLYWVVESTGLGGPLELTPIIKDKSRLIIKIEA
jgi:hypothetical protein